MSSAILLSTTQQKKNQQGGKKRDAGNLAPTRSEGGKKENVVDQTCKIRGTVLESHRPAKDWGDRTGKTHPCEEWVGESVHQRKKMAATKLGTRCQQVSGEKKPRSKLATGDKVP